MPACTSRPLCHPLSSLHVYRKALTLVSGGDLPHNTVIKNQRAAVLQTTALKAITDQIPLCTSNCRVPIQVYFHLLVHQSHFTNKRTKAMWVPVVCTIKEPGHGQAEAQCFAFLLLKLSPLSCTVILPGGPLIRDNESFSRKALPRCTTESQRRKGQGNLKSKALEPRLAPWCMWLLLSVGQKRKPIFPNSGIQGLLLTCDTG